MKPIAKKILEMGLVTQDMAQLMEKWGYLPPGAADKFKEFMEVMPKGDINKWVEELAEELEKEHQIRETNLDLAQLRWPAKVDIFTKSRSSISGDRKFIAGAVVAVKDVAGHFFFRIQDIKEDWIVPGYILEWEATPDGRHKEYMEEVIAEKQILYIDDTPVCVQVTTLKEV